MYRITFEDILTNEKEVYDELDGCIVAIADAEGGYGFLDTDFRYKQANFEMLAYAKALYEYGLEQIRNEFRSFLDEVNAQRRYKDAVAVINRKVREIKEKAPGR